jgi:hypothetical protein
MFRFIQRLVGAGIYTLWYKMTFLQSKLPKQHFVMSVEALLVCVEVNVGKSVKKLR